MTLDEKTARLNQFVKAKGWSKSAFGRAIGIPRQNVDRYLSGKSDASKYVIKLMTHGLNIEWYETGKGEMYAGEKKENPKPEKATEADRLTAVEKQLKELKKNCLTPPDLTDQVQIPLYQHAVSAGPACTVSDEVEEYIPVSKKIVKHPRETFAVRASGDSMKGADIHEGDIIICDARGTVKTGSIVVASVDGAQTLKKIVLKQGTVTLEPANHNHTTIAITDNSDLAILGVVIALFRIMP